jgi:hypothetical protein
MVTSLEFDGQLRGDEISKADDAAWPGLPLRSHCRQERLLAGSSLPATSMDCRIRVARRQCAPEISRARRSTAPGRDEPKRSSSWPPETGHPRRASRGNSERITRGRLWPGLPIRGVRRQLPLSKPTIKPKDCCLAWPGTVSPGHNRSHREPKDRAATDRFPRYCGRRPSSVPGIEIPKAAARCLSMPKIRRPSAAHDIEWAQPTLSCRWSGRNAGRKADIEDSSLATLGSGPGPHPVVR